MYRDRVPSTTSGGSSGGGEAWSQPIRSRLMDSHFTLAGPGVGGTAFYAVLTMQRSTSAMLHAWATQPRGT